MMLYPTNPAGAGGNVTGRKDSPGIAANSSSGIIGFGAKIGRPNQPRAAINTSQRVIFAATGVAQMCQVVFVAPDCNVFIRAHNGTSSGNAAICYVGHSQEELNSSGGDVITPDTEISYPVDHTGQIWAVGKLGDGITVSIRANTQI
jgi:hypothetical protein